MWDPGAHRQHSRHTLQVPHLLAKPTSGMWVSTQPAEGDQIKSSGGTQTGVQVPLTILAMPDQLLNLPEPQSLWPQKEADDHSQAYSEK